MKKTPIPEGVVYEPGINALEALPVKKELETVTYGETPIQIGYCNGHNSKLNAVEYHRSSEINVAATDAILLLGQLADVAEDFTYDTSKMEAFLVPAVWKSSLLLCIMHPAVWTVRDFRWQLYCPRALIIRFREPIRKWIMAVHPVRMHCLPLRISG